MSRFQEARWEGALIVWTLEVSELAHEGEQGQGRTNILKHLKASCHSMKYDREQGHGTTLRRSCTNVFLCFSYQSWPTCSAKEKHGVR